VLQLKYGNRVDFGIQVEDSMITCEYCGKKFPSKDMDEHLFEVHGMTA
jgi:hypothetical protein